ncbi:MAG: 16S rRNA (cytosine(1402)-N(4))-methyltransferase RsmH [Pseudomonadota bacterium]
MSTPHIPVLIDPILTHAAPIKGVWIDGTFGAGGYTRALLAAGAARVIGIDQDPMVFEMARVWSSEFAGKLELIEGRFGDLDDLVGGRGPVDGVVLDIGVSSMQLDQAERGFSFMADGPLDMRMGQSGLSAADLVNRLREADLADVLYQFGEERASRRIAKKIVAARPFETTLELAEVITSALPRPKPGQPHPATRSFQALRIAVNDELGQLVQGLMAAERALAAGGVLAVVTFHSLEDRIVKRFFQARSGGAARANRYAPQTDAPEAQFEMISRKAIAPSPAEVAENPRARSAKLRIGRRTAVPAGAAAPYDWGLPKLDLGGMI